MAQTGQSTRKGTGQVAVKPLKLINYRDIQAGKAKFDKWLRKKTNDYLTLQKVTSFASNFPVISNIIALVDVVGDVAEIIEKPVAKAGLMDWVNLGVDLIAVIPIPMGTAVVRTTLRPTLTLVKQAKASAKGNINNATIEIISLALSDVVAGPIEKFATSAKAKLPDILNNCASKTQEISNSVNKGISDLVAGKVFNTTVPKPATRNIKKQTGFWEGLGNDTVLLAKKGINAYASVAMTLAPTTLLLNLGKNFKTLGDFSAKKIRTLGDPKVQNSIGWLLDMLIQGITAYKAKKKPVTIPAQKTVQSQKKVGNVTLEKQKVEAKGKKDACPCKNCPTGTPHTISFALGTEFVTHTDAFLNLPFNFNLSRTYASNLYYMDEGEFGARWITPFSVRIVVMQTEEEYQTSIEQHKKPIASIDQILEFIYFDGRAITLKKLSVGEIHYQDIEGFYYTAVNEDIILVYFNDGMHLVFEKAGYYFRLSYLQWVNNFTVGLNYNHLVQGQSILSDIVVKHNDEILSHIHTQLNAQNKISQCILLEGETNAQVLSAYDYNQYGDLITAITQDAHQYNYQYHKHLLTQYSDLTGRLLHLEWDGEGADARAYHEYSEGGHNEAKLQWDENIRLTYVANAHGDETWYYYDYEGYNYRIVYPDGLEEWFFRDDAKNVVRHIATDGTTTEYDFDENSNLLKLTQVDGAEFYYGYNEQNKLTHFRDADGNIWQREYDEQGNLTVEIDPLERKTQYQYNSMGLPVSIQDAKGGVKQLSYNKQGQLTQYTDCSGKATHWQYDARGRLKQTANALGETTEYVYTELSETPLSPLAQDLPLNAVGQLEKIIHADHTEEHFIHDAEGRLLVHIDPKGQRTQYEYDVAGRISKRTDAMKQTLKYHWDKLGRLTKLSNENGASYHFHYDVMGRLTKETDFDGKETVYHYSDTSGELQRSIELAKATQGHQPKHRIQAFEFDAMGRLSQRTAGFSHSIEKLLLEQDEDTEELNAENALERLEHAISEEFAYDGNGQLIQAKNESSRVQFFYNEVGNLSHEHHHDSKTQRTAVWQHLYDELNNRTTTHRPDGQKVDWLLYGSGHVYGLALNGKDTVSFKRDDLHREIERHYANGLSQQQQYDQVGHLILQNIEQDNDAGYNTNPNTEQNQNQNNAQSETKALLKRLYHYDKVGQLTDIHDKRRGHIEYKYDPVGRLLQANSNMGKEVFAFDPASNIINPNKSGNTNNGIRNPRQDTYFEPTHKHGYNSLVNNVVQDYINQKYQYDDYGQLIRQSEGGHLQYFEWDALGRLVRSKNDKAETHYRYDALGRRIEKSKQHIQAGHSQYTETTQYGWDGNTLAYESSNQYTKHYVYENGSFVPLIQATYRQQINQHQTPTWENGYDYDKDPLWHTEQKANAFNRVWFYHCDHLGTPQEMSDQTGAIVWTAEYKAWGECKTENHTKRDIWDSEIITNNLRFQGQYFDQETGLHYNRFRYYSPYVGRFISKDPIGLLGGLNTFAYAPNPVGWVDPLGLTCISNLSSSERKALMEQKLEANAKRRLEDMQNSTPNAHYLERHGAHLSDASQLERATTGRNPTTGNISTNRRGQVMIPPAATNFYSHRDQLNAINRAEQIFKHTGNMEPNIDFGRPVGRGYERGGATFGIRNTATVYLNASGKAISAFPQW